MASEDSMDLNYVTTSKRKGVSEMLHPHNFSSLVDLSHVQLYSPSSLLELHHSRSLAEVPSVTLAEWREARMRHEVFDPESDHPSVKHPHLRKDFHRERKGRAYCAHCGKMVKTKVGKTLNSCCLGSMFVVLLLCPILVLCAWIPLVWIDSQSQKIVCSKCDNEIGRHIPKKPKEIKGAEEKENSNGNMEEKNKPKNE